MQSSPGCEDDSLTRFPYPVEDNRRRRDYKDQRQPESPLQEHDRLAQSDYSRDNGIKKLPFPRQSPNLVDRFHTSRPSYNSKYSPYHRESSDSFNGLNRIQTSETSPTSHKSSHSYHEQSLRTPPIKHGQQVLTYPGYQKQYVTLETKSLFKDCSNSVPETLTFKKPTESQLKELNGMFEINNSPSRTDRLLMAKEFKIEPKVVQVWFLNRRKQFKKQNEKLNIV
jgi:hypothetical protein